MESIAHGNDEFNNLELEGMTVREILDKYAQIFNLPSNGATEVNGQRVGSDYVLKAGDSLEIVRETGVKGAIAVDFRRAA